MAFLCGVFAPSPSGTYDIRGTFFNYWGDDAAWWATCFITLGLLGMVEMAVKMAKRALLVVEPWKLCSWRKRDCEDNAEEIALELWQEMEQDPVLRARLEKLARDDDMEGEEGEEEGPDEADEGVQGGVET